jgi:hypothetical protein
MQEIHPEKLRSLKDAAQALGIPVWKLRRAVKAGIVPSYSILNSRRQDWRRCRHRPALYFGLATAVHVAPAG